MGVIRILLALIVAGDHFAVINLQRAGLTRDGIQQWVYMSAGYAVMFFYVISGFLISYALSNKYTSSETGITDFFKSRIIRIFSLYWPLLLINSIFFGLKDNGWNPRDIFINIFLLGGDWVLAFQAYPNEKTPFLPSLGQAWSVSAELTFYLLAPFVLRSLPATVSLMVFSLVTRITLEHIYGGFHQAWDYHFFPSALWFFLMGHLSRKIYDGGFLRFRGSSVILLISSLLMLAGTRHTGGFVSPFFYSSIICFALALPGIFEATKNNKIMNFLGDMSYPFYLIHMMVLWQFAPVASEVSGASGIDLITMAKAGTPLPIVVSMFVAAVFLVSIATHYLIERPCSTGFKKILGLLWPINKFETNSGAANPGKMVPP